MIYAVCVWLLKFSDQTSLLLGVGIGAVAFVAMLLAPSKAPAPQV